MGNAEELALVSASAAPARKKALVTNSSQPPTFDLTRLVLGSPHACALMDRQLNLLVANEPWRELSIRLGGSLLPTKMAEAWRLELLGKGEEPEAWPCTLSHPVVLGEQGWLLNTCFNLMPSTGLLICQPTLALLEESGSLESLRRENAQFRFAMNQAGLVSITDVKGTILFANDLFCQVSGYAREELLGANHRIIKSAIHDAEFFRQMWRTIGQGRVWRGEMCNRSKSGMHYWVDSTIVPLLGEGGKPFQYLSFRRVIDQRKKLEQDLLKAKEDAERAMQAKADFLSLMSHEIRTPLNAVIGLAHLLRQDRPAAHQGENLDSLLFSAENLLLLVNDILDYSKIEAGKLDLERTPFEPATLLRRLCNSFASRSREKGLAFCLELDPSTPKWLAGDPLRLSQVLNNLLGNALKFTERGSISLTVSLHGCKDGICRLQFAVKDTGIGIPPERQAHIFERFTQGEKATSRRYGGTGLGLAISSALLRQMGSEIHLRSKPKRGSTFFFSLDFSQAQPPPQAEQVQPERAASGRPRILIAEDNPINVQVLEKFLKLWQMDFAHASDGQQAVELHAKERFDLVLMDAHMPGLDGLQACAAIRRRDDTIPILAMTADISEAMSLRTRQAGMSDLITKPFDPSQLKGRIHHWLGRNEEIKQASSAPGD
jgi:PAS domain S-box-containing protein